jgi:hypothetical protein
MQTYITVTPQGRVNGIYKKSLDFTTTIEISEEVYQDLVAESLEYTFIEGVLTKQSQHQAQLLEEKKAAFRVWRAEHMAKYDLLGLWIMRGDYDPNTHVPYSPITAAERQWLFDVRNFPAQITVDTTEADYPTLPYRLM